MNSKYYKIFFMVIGIISLIYMAYNLGFNDIWMNIRRTGIWFIPVIGSWLIIYVLNALAFKQIIHEPGLEKSNLPILRVLRITVTGYAINYITPFVALGGEPYRIMELNKTLGIHKATSSVLLYGLMHVFSHILFWLLSILVIVSCLDLDSTALLGCAAAFILGILISIWFLSVYKKGFTVSIFNFLQKVPFMKKKVRNFAEKKADALLEIDNQIRVLYADRRSRFYKSLLFELLARVVTCSEIYFTAVAIGLDMSFFEALIVSSASSLFANLIFFMPMQLGAREGGLALALKSISLPADAGIFIGIVMRIRELVWIFIGLILIRTSAAAVGTGNELPDKETSII